MKIQILLKAHIMRAGRRQRDAKKIKSCVVRGLASIKKQVLFNKIRYKKAKRFIISPLKF